MGTSLTTRGRRAAAIVTLGGAVLLAGANAVPAQAAPPPGSPGNGPHKVIYPTVATAQNHRAQKAAAGQAAASLLSFGGGVDGIGVTTGTPKTVLVFWGTQWGTSSTGTDGYVHFTGDPQGMAPRVQAMLSGLGTGGELWSGTMTQYCQGVATGATSCPAGASHVGFPSGGNLLAIYQTTSAAPSNASGAQIAQVAVSAAQALNLSTRNIQYVIVSPTGTHPDGFNAPLQWCAWHDWNGDWGVGSPSQGDVAFTNLPYLTDVGASCGSNFVNSGSGGTLDGVTIVEGHEYAETITDQNPAGGWTDASGAENGDKCAWITPNTPGGAGNVSMGTGSFPMQSTWANDSASCDLSHPVVGSTNPDFTLSASPPSQSVQQGSPATYTVTVTPANGFNGSVSLSATGLPSGALASFNPTSITGGAGSSTLTITTGNTTPTGTSNLTVTGTSGSLTHTANVSLTVNGPPNFSLSASPSSQSVGQNGTTSYTVTVSPTNGFNGAVTLTTNTLPSGVVASFSPNPATSTSTMTVTTSGAALGTDSITITGTSGSLTHTTGVSLVVTSAPTLHFSSLSTSARVRFGYWTATGTATVLNQNNQAVSGVTVTITFVAPGGGSASGSCVTTTSGSCSVSARVSLSTTSVTITTTSASKSGYLWDGHQISKSQVE
jgi:hypothetical protein